MKVLAALLLSITGCGSVSTIGGTDVPNDLHCQEDEVITFTGPDTLDCVHIDALGEQS